jgi:hypothetical protein
LEKVGVSLSAAYRQIFRKVQLTISHYEIVEPKRQKSWQLRYVKTCHRVPQNIEAQGLGKGFWEQGYRLGIGL